MTNIWTGKKNGTFLSEVVAFYLVLNTYTKLKLLNMREGKRQECICTGHGQIYKIYKHPLVHW